MRITRKIVISVLNQAPKHRGEADRRFDAHDIGKLLEIECTWQSGADDIDDILTELWTKGYIELTKEWTQSYNDYYLYNGAEILRWKSRLKSEN